MRISDWSSDVCSSDLPPPCCHRRNSGGAALSSPPARTPPYKTGIAGYGRGNSANRACCRGYDIWRRAQGRSPDRKRVVQGKSVSVRVGRGGRRSVKKKKEDI